MKFISRLFQLFFLLITDTFPGCASKTNTIWLDDLYIKKFSEGIPSISVKTFRLADPPMGTWGAIPNPLQISFLPVTVWYRQQLTPGAAALRIPEFKGKYSLIINGALGNTGKQN